MMTQGKSWHRKSGKLALQTLLHKFVTKMYKKRKTICILKKYLMQNVYAEFISLCLHDACHMICAYISWHSWSWKYCLFKSIVMAYIFSYLNPKELSVDTGFTFSKIYFIMQISEDFFLVHMLEYCLDEHHCRNYRNNKKAKHC